LEFTVKKQKVNIKISDGKKSACARGGREVKTTEKDKKEGLQTLNQKRFAFVCTKVCESRHFNHE
jgi:hypothetical protein